MSDARRLVAALAALALVLIAIGLSALFVGSAGLSPSAVARALTGRADAEVLAVRKITGPDGKTLSFEVDIR